MRGTGNHGVDGQVAPDWTTRAERGNPRAMRLMSWLSLRLGRRCTRLLLSPICLYFMLSSAHTRAVSRKYLRKVLQREPGLRHVYRHLHTFAVTVLDRIYVFNGQHALFDVRVHGEDIVAGMAARGESCFLLGAHMGSFEIVRATGRDALGSRVSLVMYEDNVQKFNAVLGAINPKLRMQVIAMGRFDSMLKVEAALEGGGFVGMLADRTIQGEGTIACEFLGARAQFPSGPFRIACMLKQPVVLMIGLYRGGNRYDVYFERLADMRNVPRAQRDEVLGRALRDYVARLEHYCAQEPYNWYNFYDFWK